MIREESFPREGHCPNPRPSPNRITTQDPEGKSVCEAPAYPAAARAPQGPGTGSPPGPGTAPPTWYRRGPGAARTRAELSGSLGTRSCRRGSTWKSGKARSSLSLDTMATELRAYQVWGGKTVGLTAIRQNKNGSNKSERLLRYKLHASKDTCPTSLDEKTHLV